MHLIYEIVSLFLIYLAGMLLSNIIPLPGSLLSLLLFFILLMSGVLKEDRFHRFSDIILGNLAFFFMPPAVQVLDSMHLLSGNLVKLIIILVISNFLVMGVSGMVVQFFLKKDHLCD